MKTILFVETGTGFGGSGQCLLALVSALNKENFNPIIVAYQAGDSVVKIRNLGFPVYVLDSSHVKRDCLFGFLNMLLQNIPRFFKLVSLIRKNNVSLIHVNNDLYSAFAPIVAARFTRSPVICHIRLTRPQTRFERWLGTLCNCLIAITNNALEDYKKVWPSSRIEMVYDAIDTNGTYHSDNSFRKKLAIAQDAPLIGLIARCVEGKGYDDFIKAAAIVMRQSKNAKFVIVGNGPGGDADYETSMRSLSRQLGLNGFLKWAGWQQDMGYVLRDMDIFVHASSTFPEGLPHVLLEAMVAGKPIVATALPSTKEVVVHEKTGLLVEPGNHQALAVGILKILSDSQMASNFVSAGRIRARELFSLDVHVRRIESIYYSLLY